MKKIVDEFDKKEEEKIKAIFADSEKAGNRKRMMEYTIP